MKRSIAFWQSLGFIVTAALGTLLHFLYDWTGNVVVATFSAVNESTWEHMKLLFFPQFLVAVGQYSIFGRNIADFWCIKLRSTLLGLALIPMLFYTLRGIFGTTPDWINIGIFFVAAATTYLYETHQFKQPRTPCPNARWAFAAFLLVSAAFAVFTFRPPQIPLFQDPLSGHYGLTSF